ncbi:MAG TPA: hypothetical protein VGC79_31710, partial [Polyangiaceae bacterium]
MPEELVQARRVQRNSFSLITLSLCLLLVGVAPSACLSDVVLPPCVRDKNCSADAGQTFDEAAAGALPEGGKSGTSSAPAASGGSGNAAGLG